MIDPNGDVCECIAQPRRLSLELLWPLRVVVDDLDRRPRLDETLGRIDDDAPRLLGDYEGLTNIGNDFVTAFVQVNNGNGANRTDAFKTTVSP